MRRAMRLKSVSLLFRNVLSVAIFVAVTMAPAWASAQAVGPRPCDLYAPATPCVAAVSTTRALYSAYKGPLYQVTRVNDNATRDIGLLPDGYADTAPQHQFCRDTFCTISKLYDQSPNHNDLTPAPPGGAMHGLGPNGYDVPAVADALPLTVGGHKVYGVLVNPGTGYRNDAPKAHSGQRCAGRRVHGDVRASPE